MKLSPATTVPREGLREVGIPKDHVSSGEPCPHDGTPPGVCDRIVGAVATCL